ncbi:hypothetical protein ACTQ33_07380 [Candidatus Avoscillospira sp. LCP25S3_F1]|uniref:hypothetical protein n=1 Tax=Candidatus Avoscillospira sp. LCP25S3_F1 TaxID=3438825 RepID=UPI003F8E2782
MEWWVNLILWGTVIWIPILMYVQTVNDAKFKKNIAVGVTIPPEAQQDPELLATIGQFRKTEKRLLWALLLSAVLLALLPLSLGVLLTIYLIWLDVIIVVPMVPYVRCNQALKAMKQRRGWRRPDQTAAATVADLSTVDLWKEKPRTVLYFLLPFVLSLLPTAAVFLEGDAVMGWVMAAVGPLWVALSWVFYRYAIRRKAEVVDDNATLTETLTRLRRQAWRRVWLWMAWLMGLLPWCMVFYTTQPVVCIVSSIALTIVFTAAAVWQEFRLRAIQSRLTAGSSQTFYVDEDDKWVWGMFYYNPHDTNLMINARVGINATVNLARKPGKFIIGVSALMLLLMPLFGVWILVEEQMPVELSVQGDILEARHSGTHYEIALDAISSVDVLEELPRMVKVAGTGLESVCKGQYNAGEYGRVTACIDPRTGPWLLVTDEDGARYLLGDSDGTTAQVAAVLPQS